MSEIPIRNVYYLLCYAWEQMREGRIAEAGATGRTELADLFAQVLANGTQRLLRQGLDRGYVPRSEDTSRIRGRIDFSTSAKRALLPQAKAHCTYDELSRNVLHNQILRSTLRLLAQVEGLDPELSARLKRLKRRFGGVEVIPLRRQAFSRLQLHAGNAFYRFLMSVCELVHESVIVTESGAWRFRDFRRDDATMWDVFENFVFNFYAHEQDAYRVHRPRIEWDLSHPFDSTQSASPQQSASPERPARLPAMQTDIVLESDSRTIIIDTKFYAKTLQSYHDRQSYHSGNLYQLFSYLKNAEARGGSYTGAEGLLLYPTVSVSLHDSFSVQGHRLRVATIDLAQDWRGIRRDLLRFAGVSAAEAGAAEAKPAGSDASPLP